MNKRFILLLPFISFCLPFCPVAAAPYDASMQMASRQLDEAVSLLQNQTSTVNQQLDEVEAALNHQQKQSMAMAQLKPVQKISSKPSATSSSDQPVHFISREMPFKTSYNNFSSGVKRHQFGFAREIYWAQYKEPQVMHQEGMMTGYRATYTYRPSFKEFNVVRVEMQWADGKFNYHSADGLANVQDKKNRTYELRGLIGKDFYNEPSKITTTPYFGFGYRYLKDDGEGLDADIGGLILLGYKRMSNYYYLPMGIEFLYQPATQYSVLSNLEFDYLVRGSQVSKLGVVPGYGTVTNAQKRGYGFRSSLKFNWNFKYCTAFAEGLFRYWSIGESTKVPDPTDPNFDLIEPKNNTKELGLRFGLEI